jgi:APA family basic amino acid/polyamine antiporter
VTQGLKGYALGAPCFRLVVARHLREDKPIRKDLPTYNDKAPRTEVAANPADMDFGLQRKLGLFDATMLVMGGIIGSGIFINSYVVARQVHTPLLILGAWFAGGLIALAGGFIWAELSAQRPDVGGQYAYIREAYHPAAAFLYGWSLLLVIQTGGMAAVAVTFAHYFGQLTGARIPQAIVAAGALALLTAVNCLGVRSGGAVQSALMVLKILAIASLVACGLLLIGPAPAPPVQPLQAGDKPISMATAMIPVLFAYGGWQTSCFVAGEVKEPRKNMPRALLIGVAGVITIYLAVNYVYLRALGPVELARVETPASAVMEMALGSKGAILIAVGIAISTLGFLSQSILTAPRVYYAMATDGLFFKSVAWLEPRTHVPVVAIILQGILAMVIAVSGRYDQILNYVVSVDFIFFGLTGTCIFIFRRRGLKRADEGGGAGASLASATGRAAEGKERQSYRVPGHPVTTALFVAVCWTVVVNTIYQYPSNTVIGLVIVLGGIPVYFFWRWWRGSNER